jgi:hypothetical protein
MATSSAHDGAAGKPKQWVACRFALIKAHFCRGCPSHLTQCPSRRYWRRPQSYDEPQQLLEHLPWHCHLGHLERKLAAMADDLGTDLDLLLAQAGQ